MASAMREAEAWVSDRGGEGKVEAAVREADWAKTGRVRKAEEEWSRAVRPGRASLFLV